MDQTKRTVFVFQLYGMPARDLIFYRSNFRTKPPPSLKNIFKELATDIDGFVIPSHGNLGKWADQGILLLNATLTVESAKANSHSKFGWDKFTDAVIRKVSKRNR